MTLMADTGWPAYRSDFPSTATDQNQPRFAPHHRLGLERRRHPANEIAALPRTVSVLCGRRQAILPTVSTQRRYLPRRAVQYCLLRIVDAYGGAAGRTGSGRFHLDRRRLPSVFEST